MLGWMDDAALRATRETGLVHFFSRSRQRLWRKGETSGNTLRVTEIVPDCDDDALVVRARPDGPTCHDGATSCFTPWLGRKVGEEAVELTVASLSEDDAHVVSEAADLWFHTLLLLRSRGLDPAAVEDELRRRER